jgi:glycosyltransferase involved in cell wall biosynthesis
MKEDYIPKDQRKKILLLCDDIRMHSGIATMAREFVIGLSHKYNWAQIAGSVQHPDKGRVIDLSEATKNDTGIPDPYVRLYPTDGYGNPDMLKQIMQIEKPDAILHFTDPRFWIWLYQIEREIRQICPIGFYSIWDDLPYPMYNRAYYESCDWIGCISKQTENIVKNVLGKAYNKPTAVTYVPHGINPTTFHPIQTVDERKKVDEMSKQLFKGKSFDFVMLYNNRNIRRKQTSTILLAWKAFCANLTAEERKKVAFVLHTAPIDENGTDLPACIEAFGCENVFFSTGKLPPADMNTLYNLADVTINLSDNEGFGLGTAESLMAGTPIIVTATGGLQDQCGFTDVNGDLQSFDTKWGSNHDARNINFGSWVTPIFPGARMVQGSVPTPYILADYARWEDAAKAIMYWYTMPRETRKQNGVKGREYCLGVGNLNADYMCKTMSEGLDAMMANWKGRERFNLHRHDEYVGHQMPSGSLGFEMPVIDRDEAVEFFG